MYCYVVEIVAVPMLVLSGRSSERWLPLYEAALI